MMLGLPAALTSYLVFDQTLDDDDARTSCCFDQLSGV